MLAGLRLRTRFVGGNQKQRAVHDGSAVKHGGHQNIMTGAVHEGYVAHEVHGMPTLLARGVVLEKRAGRDAKRDAIP